MKSATSEATQANTPREKRYKIADAIEDYRKKHERFTARQLDTTYTGRKTAANQIVPAKLYKAIVKNYLMMWTYDWLFNYVEIYFWLGGLAKKVQVRTDKNPKGSIGIMWIMRPCKRFHNKAILQKMIGSTNWLPKLITLWRQDNDQDVLPIFTEEIKLENNRNRLYRCIQE